MCFTNGGLDKSLLRDLLGIFLTEWLFKCTHIGIYFYQRCIYHILQPFEIFSDVASATAP